MKHIQIQMLGKFSLRYGDATVSDADNRSKKVWALLAYLICNRDRSIPQQRLIQMFWGDSSGSGIDTPEDV